MVAPLIATFGLLAFGASDDLMLAGFGSLSLSAGAIAYDALRTGKTLGDAGAKSAESNPFMFWFRVVFYIALLLIVLVSVVVFHFR